MTREIVDKRNKEQAENEAGSAEAGREMTPQEE
jgi:hypothetical protein